jgi:hypothetical protein
MYDIDNVSMLLILCPFCAAVDHQSVMVKHEPNNHRVRTEQAQAQYDARLAAYNSGSRRRQSLHKLPMMKAACVCSAQHHWGNIKGGNCWECRSAYAADPMWLFAPRAGCVTCNCNCNALFNVEDLSMIQRAIVDGIDGKTAAGSLAVKQPTISTYQVMQLHTATNILFLQAIWPTLYLRLGKDSIAVSRGSSSNQASIASTSK